MLLVGGVMFILWYSDLFLLCEGAPQLCHEDRPFHNISREEGSNGSLTVCIISRCKVSGCLHVHAYQMIRQKEGVLQAHKPNGILETSRFKHTWTQNETMQHLHQLHLEIYNITQNDYGVWNVVISANGHRNLSFSIQVLNPCDVNNVSFMFRSVKASNELTLTLSCTAGGYPTSVEIRNVGHTKTMAKSVYNTKNYQRELEARHEISPALCSHMTTYECAVGMSYLNKTETVKTLDVPVEKCPARLCKHQSQNFTVYAYENYPAHFTMCVVAFPRISDIVFIDDAPYSVGNSTTVRLDTKNSTIYNYVTVRIERVGVRDFKIYKVRIMSLLNDSVTLTVELVKTVKNTTSNSPPVCTNRSSVCAVLHYNTHLLLYLEKDFYKQYTIKGLTINASRHQDAELRFLEPTTLDLKFWTLGRQGEMTTHHFHHSQEDNWVFLGEASGLTFCYDYGLQVHWKHRGHGHSQDKHISNIAVALKKLHQPTFCSKTIFSLSSSNDETVGAFYTLRIEDSFKRYNVTKEQGIVRPAKLSLFLILSIAGSICIILVIITSLVCLRKRNKRTVTETPQESTYLTIVDSTYETVNGDNCVARTCFRS